MSDVLGIFREVVIHATPSRPLTGIVRNSISVSQIYRHSLECSSAVSPDSASHTVPEDSAFDTLLK